MLDRLQQSFDNNVLPYLQSPLFIGGVIGIILVLLITFLVVRSRMRAMRIFKTHAGSVHVSRAALRDLVYSACRRVNTANRPRVTFFPKYGKLNLSVKLKLIEGQRMTDVTAQLQSRIAEALHETLSMEKVGNINIFFTGIRPDKSGKVVTTSEPLSMDEPKPANDEISDYKAPVDDVSHDHAESKMTKDEELALSETPFIEEEESEPSEEKPKRGFFGFGSRKPADKPSGEDDTSVPDEEILDGDDALVEDEPNEEKKY